MKVLRSILSELIGLFVDDGSLAIAIITWVALCAFLFWEVPAISGLMGGLLLAGLVALFCENVTRGERK
jgi:hypothetical protein